MIVLFLFFPWVSHAHLTASICEVIPINWLARIKSYIIVVRYTAKS